MAISQNTAHSVLTAMTVWPDASNLIAQFLARERRLSYFALLMIGIAIVFALSSTIDVRQWRGVPIWLKPFKFAVSTALFALTSAWFIGLLPAPVRQSTAVNYLVWTLILTASFEVVYIALQALLGQGSHHNTTDPFHATMFGLMGVAALALTATQAALAVLITVHHREVSSAVPALPPEVLAVVIGLWLTFILGSISGFALGANQPPEGSGLPLLGWQLGLRDFRPAHFLGIHAHQLIPFAGFMVVSLGLPSPNAWVVGLSVAYTLGWIVCLSAWLEKVRWL